MSSVVTNPLRVEDRVGLAPRVAPKSLSDSDQKQKVTMTSPVYCYHHTLALRVVFGPFLTLYIGGVRLNLENVEDPEINPP